MRIIILLIALLSCSEKENISAISNDDQNSSVAIEDTIRMNPVKKEIKINPDAPKGIYKNKDFKKVILAEIITNLGSMTFELYPNRSPIATENFINLAKKGFYNKNRFFRVEQDFVAQTGDKTNTGYRDAGYYFKTETHPDLSHDRAGILSYANYDMKSNSSQFFITLSAQTQLDRQHPIFGMILSGKETLNKINECKVDKKNRPLKDIFIKKIKILIQ